MASEVAKVADELVHSCTSKQRTDPVETIASELIPFCDAIRWIGRRGPSVLATKRTSLWDRPLWLWGVRSHIRRDPLGRVLVIGAWNYPLLLPGVQIAQALAAGNRVYFKPAPGTEASSERLISCFHRAGVNADALTLLPSSVEAATQVIEQGVDLIVLTGSAKTGRALLTQAASKLTPCILELGGCDAVIVLPGADVDRLCRAIQFGLTFNAGATCIGPRRLFVPNSLADKIIERLAQSLRQCDEMLALHPASVASVISTIESAIDTGAKDSLARWDAESLRARLMMKPLLLDEVNPQSPIASSDLFAPVISVIRVDSPHQAVSIVNDSTYRLGASIFGPQADAGEIAAMLKVGSIVINDLIAPTADPRLPFGGRGESGFGTTRGAAGLLAMTVPVAVSTRRGRWTPHLMPRRTGDAETLLGSLQLMHGKGFSRRYAALRRMISAAKSSSRKSP